MLIPCSRSAHDQNVLARRPQWDQHGCHSKREKQASLTKKKVPGTIVHQFLVSARAIAWLSPASLGSL